MSRLARQTKLPIAVAALVLAASIASGQDPPRMCTIPDAKMEAAKATFAKIAAVFRHPRCINCHGGESPFASNTSHEGGKYEVIKDRVGFAEGGTFTACEECHNAFAGWQTPPDSMSFVGKDDTALCKQLKSELRTGSQVIKHFTQDVGFDFIGEAFRGTRGLNGEGQGMVAHHPEPIQGVTRSQLVSWGREWLDELGSGEGDIGGDSHSDCGCVPHHYALEFHDHVMLDMQGVHWETGLTSDPLVRLIFDDNETFHSETATASRPGVGTNGPCKLQSGGSVAVSAKGTLVLGENELFGRAWNATENRWGYMPGEFMKVAVTEENAGVSAGVECPKGSLSTNLPEGSGSFDLELKAVVGAKSKEITTVPGVRGAIWLKIVQID